MSVPGNEAGGEEIEMRGEVMMTIPIPCHVLSLDGDPLAVFVGERTWQRALKYAEISGYMETEEKLEISPARVLPYTEEDMDAKHGSVTESSNDAGCPT
jgi:hypothetical protein